MCGGTIWSVLHLLIDVFIFIEYNGAVKNDVRNLISINTE